MDKALQYIEEGEMNSIKQFLIQNNVQFPDFQKMVEVALDYGQLSMIKYFHNSGLLIPKMLKSIPVDKFAKYGNFELIYYLQTVLKTNVVFKTQNCINDYKYWKISKNK